MSVKYFQIYSVLYMHYLLHLMIKNSYEIGSVITILHTGKLTLRDMKCLAPLYTAGDGDGEKSSDAQGCTLSSKPRLFLELKSVS